MAKLIVVFGVTGTQVRAAFLTQSIKANKKQGGSVASTFFSSGWSVRGITRNDSTPAAQALVSAGIEIVQADLDDPSSLSNVFAGAHAVYAVTDFWAPFFAAYPRLASISERATGEHAFAIELSRGRNIADAAAAALAKEGILEHFIWSSLPSVKEASNGKYDFVYHFDAKAEVSTYVEKELPKLWMKTSLLWMGFYANNALKYEMLRPTKEADGSYTWLVHCDPKAEHPFVEPKDAGVLAKLLVDTEPGKTLLGAGDVMSYETYNRLWAKRCHIDIRSMEASVEDVAIAVPGGLGKEVAMSTVFSAEFGWGTGLTMPKDVSPWAWFSLIVRSEYMLNFDSSIRMSN